MTTRVATSGRHVNVRRQLSQIKLALAALLGACVVAATLAAVPSPARAEAATNPLDNAPLVLSGTISYAFSYSVTGPCTGCHTSESLSVSMAVAGRALSGDAGDPGPIGTTRTCTVASWQQAPETSVSGHHLPSRPLQLTTASRLRRRRRRAVAGRRCPP